MGDDLWAAILNDPSDWLTKQALADWLMESDLAAEWYYSQPKAEFVRLDEFAFALRWLAHHHKHPRQLKTGWKWYRVGTMRACGKPWNLSGWVFDWVNNRRVFESAFDAIAQMAFVFSMYLRDLAIS